MERFSRARDGSLGIQLDLCHWKCDREQYHSKMGRVGTVLGVRTCIASKRTFIARIGETKRTQFVKNRDGPLTSGRTCATGCAIACKTIRNWGESGHSFQRQDLHRVQTGVYCTHPRAPCDMIICSGHRARQLVHNWRLAAVIRGARLDTRGG